MNHSYSSPAPARRIFPYCLLTGLMLAACATSGGSAAPLDQMAELRDFLGEVDAAANALQEQSTRTDESLQLLLSMRFEGNSADALRDVDDELGETNDAHDELAAVQQRSQQAIEAFFAGTEQTIDSLRAEASPLAETMSTLHGAKQQAAAAWQTDLLALLQCSETYRKEIAKLVTVLSHSLSRETLQTMSRLETRQQATAALRDAVKTVAASARQLDDLLRPAENR